MWPGPPVNSLCPRQKYVVISIEIPQSNLNHTTSKTEQAAHSSDSNSKESGADTAKIQIQKTLVWALS